MLIDDTTLYTGSSVYRSRRAPGQPHPLARPTPPGRRAAFYTCWGLAGGAEAMSLTALGLGAVGAATVAMLAALPLLLACSLISPMWRP
jgi:hypothetical protein